MANLEPLAKLTKEEALARLRELKEKFKGEHSNISPDEVLFKIYRVFLGYDFGLWFDFSEEKHLVSNEIVQIRLEALLQKPLSVQKISRYIGRIKKSSNYYKDSGYGYLEEITREDGARCLVRAIEMISES